MGKGAQKGVFVTTSSFSSQAVEYAEQIQQRMILVDGEQLTSLMLENNVGARLERTVEIKKIDTYYEMPRFLLWIIPIAFGYAVLSSNAGRMLFSLFPLVIPYALIAIDYVMSRKEVRD